MDRSQDPYLPTVEFFKNIESSKKNLTTKPPHFGNTVYSSLNSLYHNKIFLDLWLNRTAVNTCSFELVQESNDTIQFNAEVTALFILVG